MSSQKPTESLERRTETVVEPSEVRVRAAPRFASPPASAEGLVGSLVAERYLVHALLGAGGMGEVYVAEHVHMKKRVALKVLHGELVQSADIVQRFEREAIAAGRIRHPGVATAIDFGPLPDGSFYLALELIEGRSLAQELARVGVMGEARVFGIVFQIAAALEAAHAARIVHRDLKPENVMLASSADDEDFVKVPDFGIAKIRDGLPSDGPALTRAGMIFGTPEYMSPEQARGEAVDERSDLYALGMIAYELLSGKTAFHDTDLVAVLRGQMLEAPPPLPDTVGGRLGALVLRLLEKDPAKRPGSATALLRELHAAAEVEGWALPEPRTSVGTRVELRASRGMEVVPWSLAPRGVLIQPLRSLRALSMHPVSLGPRKVPFWLPVVALTFGLGLGAVAIGIRSGSRGSETHPASATEALPAPGGLDLDRVSGGDREAIGALRKALTMAEQARLQDGKPLTRAEASELANAEMALGRGYGVLKLFVPALGAYAAALGRDPALREDRGMLRDVLRALADKDAFEEAVRFCVTKLDRVGADLIYEAFVRARDSAASKERLARALRAQDVRSVASPALEVALELERAKVCAEYRASLTEHAENADARSLTKLEALATQRGCGKDARSDCFPCLRGSASKLPSALAAARSRPSPRWDDL